MPKLFFFVDLHTGYGERYKLHLWTPPSEETATLELAAAWLKGFETVSGSSKGFYKTSGDMPQFVQDHFEKKVPFVATTFEFGTLNSQTTLGSLMSLTRMILENQGHHYGYSREFEKTKVREWYSEMFNPSEEAWRQSVLDQAETTLNLLLKQFKI